MAEPSKGVFGDDARLAIGQTRVIFQRELESVMRDLFEIEDELMSAISSCVEPNAKKAMTVAVDRVLSARSSLWRSNDLINNSLSRGGVLATADWEKKFEKQLKAAKIHEKKRDNCVCPDDMSVETCNCGGRGDPMWDIGLY